MEVTTVADDEVVLHDGPVEHRYPGLDADTPYQLDGQQVRTLPRPPGERLATVCTVNDVHLGEVECGILNGVDDQPIYRSPPGAVPYPEMMSRGAVADMLATAPDAVVVKGDLTSAGTRSEYQSFLDLYRPPFGDRLLYVRGNHDVSRGESFAARAPLSRTLPGVILAILDTSVPGLASGAVSAEALDWLDALAADADRPVMVFGHHHAWDPGSAPRPEAYFGIAPDDSERLVALVARRPRIVGYFAGHTHRNRVRRFATTGDVPWAEVACAKDFPGAWAEYRVFEGGILQVVRRISAPEALAWSEKTSDMYGGLYRMYAFGTLDDRCFAFGGTRRVPSCGCRGPSTTSGSSTWRR
ncbi:MAG TPA: metallophosphoesterase [Acidimicrobiales bacterium]|nr:metallophosphoesterase [Acidimicrobiales bacterium]